jgi:hypothetical protein
MLLYVFIGACDTLGMRTACAWGEGPCTGPSNTTRWMYYKCECAFPTMDLSVVCQHVLIIRDPFPLHFLNSGEIQ